MIRKLKLFLLEDQKLDVLKRHFDHLFGKDNFDIDMASCMTSGILKLRKYEQMQPEEYPDLYFFDVKLIEKTRSGAGSPYYPLIMKEYSENYNVVWKRATLGKNRQGFITTAEGAFDREVDRYNISKILNEYKDDAEVDSANYFGNGGLILWADFFKMYEKKRKAFYSIIFTAFGDIKLKAKFLERTNLVRFTDKVPNKNDELHQNYGLSGQESQLFYDYNLYLDKYYKGKAPSRLRKIDKKHIFKFLFLDGQIMFRFKTDNRVQKKVFGYTILPTTNIDLLENLKELLGESHIGSMDEKYYIDMDPLENWLLDQDERHYVIDILEKHKSDVSQELHEEVSDSISFFVDKISHNKLQASIQTHDAMEIIESLNMNLDRGNDAIATDVLGNNVWTVKTLFPIRFERIQVYHKNKKKDSAFLGKAVTNLWKTFFIPDYCKLFSETLNTGGVKSITHSWGTYYNPVTEKAVGKDQTVQDIKYMFERLRSLCKEEELEVAVNGSATLGACINEIINDPGEAKKCLITLRQKLVLDYDKVMEAISNVLIKVNNGSVNKFSEINYSKDTGSIYDDIKTYWIPSYFETDFVNNQQIFREILEHAGGGNDNIKCYLWSTCLMSQDTSYLKSLLFFGHSGKKWNLRTDEVPMNAGLRRISKLQCLGDLFLYLNDNTYDVLRKKKKIILTKLTLNPGDIQGGDIKAKIEDFEKLFKEKYKNSPSCIYVFIFTGVVAK